jgi:hypothetical protein
MRVRAKLFRQPHAKALAQLGSPAVATRLDGVHALARLADDSERDRPTCLNVLCAYLRTPYDPDAAGPSEREVRTTAQSAIAARLRQDHPGFWPDAEINLRGAHLIDADFSGITAASFDVEGTTFGGYTRFGHATLTRYSNFERTTFSEGVGFGGTQFSQGVGFGGAMFGGIPGPGGYLDGQPPPVPDPSDPLESPMS